MTLVVQLGGLSLLPAAPLNRMLSVCPNSGVVHLSLLAGLGTSPPLPILLQSSPSLQSFCTRSCYVRFLRARAWNVAKATKMLQETLKW